jgi:hypothetical protein
MDGFIVSGPGGAPRSEGSGVSSPEGPFVREAPQTGHFILKGKVSSSSPLPDVPEPGWAYEAAEAGTYGGAQATAGDVVWCAGVNPVRWAILQSDSGSAVSVEQILSSGTKIATVTVGGQATDLYCETGGGIQTLSGDFGCETHELSPAVDESAVLYATQMVRLDQTGYESLMAGNRPSGHYEYAFGASGTLTHNSSSFTTTPPERESDIPVPYAFALSTGIDEYASGYLLNSMFIGDWPYGGAVKVSDLLAAGETGVKLDFSSSIGSDPYGDGTLDVYASFSANQDGSYTVSYSARKDAVTEDVLTAKIDGKDGSGEVVSSVDVSPLLNYIGGRIENVPAGDSEMLPLVDQENPGVEPPFYFPDFGFYNDSYQQDVSPDVDFSDGALIASFSSSLEPESFVPLCFYGDSSGMPIFAYAKIDSSTGRFAGFTFETALAGPIVLDEFAFSSGQPDPAPTGNTASLVIERVEGPVLAYRFTLYSGSGEMKKVLRLYPSCDGEIDLSGLGGGGGTSAETLSFECGVAPSAPDVSVQSAGALVTPMFYNPPFTPSTYFDVDGRTFTIKGSTFNRITSGFPTSTLFYLTVEAGDASYYFRTSSDAMAYFFSGAHGIGVGTVRHFIGSNYGFRLERREELTSSDPGGPDIVCTFGFVDCGGDLLSLGDQSVDLSCIAPEDYHGNYSRVFSNSIASGASAPYTIDLSTVANDTAGFLDVSVFVRLTSYTSIFVSFPYFYGLDPVELKRPESYTGYVLGAVHMWYDGGLWHLSYGMAASSSSAKLGIPMTELLCAGSASPSSVLMSSYRIDSVRIAPPSGTSFSESVSVAVYARRPYSIV